MRPSWQETVAGLLADLETALQAKGILDAEGGLVAGTYSGSPASAFLNWQTITEDKSLGIHNPPYVMAVLQNTIEAVNGM